MITTKIPAFKYKEETVLRDICIDFEKGKTHGIVGLNGAGKTTLFNLLSGCLKAEGCSIVSENKSPGRKEIAFIDTELYFYPKLSAREFLSVFPGTHPNWNEEKMAAMLRIPLDGLIEEFSTGMKKKLLLMSQLKQDKSIYILDEPFNGLDLETNKILEVIISTLNTKGKTVFISSHILEPLLNVCYKIHHLSDQKIKKTYSAEEFQLIEEDLFGKIKTETREELLRNIS